MTTTIYQKYIARYSEIFTLVDMNDGIDFIHSEILPSYMVAKMTDEEYDELFNELMDDKNKKSSWIEKEVYWYDNNQRKNFLWQARLLRNMLFL